MSEEQTDEVFGNAYDLYQEIRDNKGLHLRRGNGRDDILIEELCNSIGCPDDQIAEFLKEENRSAEWLMREFLQLAAPFARMFADIWNFLSGEKAPKATEDLRVRFGFDEDDVTDVDLEQFREWAETARRISTGANVSYWSSESLSDLFCIAEQVDIEGKSGSDYYPGESYQLPVIETHRNDDFEEMVQRVHNLFQNIIDTAVEHRGEGSDRYVFEQEYEGQETPLSHQNAAGTLTDLLPSWELIFENHHEVSEEDRREAVEFFQENIEPKIEIERILGYQNYQSPLDILRLPFWKNRWHTYEIWMTVQTLRALDRYDPQVRVDDGRIPIDGRDTAIVADLEKAENHDACVVSELETSHQAEEWESMRPDLSICRTQELDKESRAVVIEYKQRSDLLVSHVKEVTRKYLSGAPEAVGLAIVNYDDTPDVDLPESVELIENVRPHSLTVRDYRDLIHKYMEETELPEPLQQWVALVDVSGSMRHKYTDKEVKNALLNLLESMGYNSDIYKFNDGLTKNPQISADDIDGGLRPRGGTNLEAAIEDLYEKYEVAKNLLVVSDGDYFSPDSFPEGLENIEQCSPQELSSKLEKL